MSDDIRGSDEARKAMHAALADARDRAQPVAKVAENEHHKYKYAPAERVIREARSALAGSGLSIFPGASSLSTECGEVFMHREFELCHAEGASKIGALDWPIPRTSPTGKPLELAKEAAKVATTMLAYYLRDLLMLERPPEWDVAHDDEPREPRGRSAAPATRMPPPARAAAAPKVDALLARIAAIDSPEAFAKAEEFVHGIMEALAAGEPSDYTDAEASRLLDALEAKR